MKLAITIFTLALSSQALADCDQDQPKQSQQDGSVVRVADKAQPATPAQRRQMALDCMMRPAPFVQEPLVIELERIKDEFVMEADPYLEARETVATSS